MRSLDGVDLDKRIFFCWFLVFALDLVLGGIYSYADKYLQGFVFGLTEVFPVVKNFSEWSNVGPSDLWRIAIPYLMIFPLSAYFLTLPILNIKNFRGEKLRGVCVFIVAIPAILWWALFLVGDIRLGGSEVISAVVARDRVVCAVMLSGMSVGVSYLLGVWAQWVFNFKELYFSKKEGS